MDAASALDQFVGEVDDNGNSLKDKTKARFERRPWLDKRATEEKGSVVYTERLYVVIKCPKKDPNEFLAKDHHKKRFSRAYQEFLKMEKAVEGVVGTPIREWNGIPATKANEIFASGILTVEELASADLADRRLPKDWEFFQKSATRFLNKETEKDAILSEKDAEIAALKAQLAKPKRGRPKNDTTDDSTECGGSPGDQAAG